MDIKDLSPDQCILLTVHFASEANIPALHSFTPTRLDALEPEFVLRILLTYLPETTEPQLYRTYISEVASRLYLDIEREDIHVDTSSVSDISPEQARKKIKHLNVLEIEPPKFPLDAPNDLLLRFLCHRAYRIEEETGALNLVPHLIEPFLERSRYLRTWYISVVLPVLRMSFEYYPAADSPLTLVEFERMQGEQGVARLLQDSTTAHEQIVTLPDGSQKDILTRDVTHLVGPWMYGHSDRKRRRLNQITTPDTEVDEVSSRVQKISLDGVNEGDKTGHDWEYVYKWLVDRAQTRFPFVTQLIEEWDGPSDIDLGGFANPSTYLDLEVQRKLELQYAQAAFASCYAAQDDSQATIRGAHGVLARLAELLDFIPPPDLATSVESLPQIEQHAVVLDQSRTLADLAPSALLTAEHPLTTPRIETYMLLQMLVYSAYQLAGLDNSISVVNVAKLQFYSTSEQQLALLRQILASLTRSGRRDEAQWESDRARLIWLWSWGLKPESDNAETGAGVLGKILKKDFEAELLKALVDTSSHPAVGVDPIADLDAAVKLVKQETPSPVFDAQEDVDRFKLAAVLTVSDQSSLTPQQSETIVYEKIMEAYDSASNGNKTRGSMKKANDVLTAFRRQFPESQKMKEAAALIAATHALSFYSLTLHHGVPFQPVNIRASQDPLELLSKVLEQNARSFAQLDDLIGVAKNFVLAGLPVDQGEEVEQVGTGSQSVEDLMNKQQRNVARRVSFMAVEAALREDDFETAYSYIINRLTPSSIVDRAPSVSKHARNSSTSSKAASHDDDISWRAAYLAGRYRPSSSSPPSLRRLEQRKELLSLALLLAPTTALTDVLSAWRRCEEEATSLQLAQHNEEREFDDKADRREPSALPGNFMLAGEQPEMILNQKRREVGRLGGAKAGESEAPLSMFDLTRNAAHALSRNVTLGRGQQSTGNASRGNSMDLSRSEDTEDSDQRFRRRDLVANAVSGGLANGIGWVLGAKPATQQRQ